MMLTTTNKFVSIIPLLVFMMMTTVLSWSYTPIRTSNMGIVSKFGITKRSSLTMKRGRGSLGKEIGIDNDNNDSSSSSSSGFLGGSNTNKKGLGSSSSGQPVINWIPIQVSTKDLPTVDNQVGIIDTNLPTMKVSQTNPTGAVSVLKYEKETYCFAVNCPSCKIPLTKAQAVPPESQPTGVDSSSSSSKKQSQQSPRLVCDFCKATYNLKTGERMKSAVPNPGIIGGIAKSIFSAQDSGPLKTYKLGEKNGKLLIALD